MQSAHLYHYKMQKERLVAVEGSGAGAGAGAVNRGAHFGGQQADGGSTPDSEAEDGSSRVRGGGGAAEGDTVYEYPGPASGANMEIVNPVFRFPQPSPHASQSIGGQTASEQFGGGPTARTAPPRPPWGSFCDCAKTLDSH